MFIVIEGLDGAGKSTQVKKIRESFERQGIATKYLHFPCFDTPVYGELIARFLRGELGALDEVNPYLVALIYAGDRKHLSATISQWLAAGEVVIVDRYVYSNIAYQCAKCADASQKEALQEWILDLEYQENGIVKPDLTLFLDVPFDFTCRKLTETRSGEERDYLNGKKDIHEASLSFQQRVREVYLSQQHRDPSFRVVDCSDDSGGMLPAEAIYEKIAAVVMAVLSKK